MLGQRELKLSEAAQVLDISYRQSKRIWKLAHGRGPGIEPGQASGSSQASAFENTPANRKRFGPTLAAEHLRKDHDLQVSVRALRLWMLAEGLWSRRRKRQPHRQRRQRKAHRGADPFDGSHHRWLEDRGPKGCLMNFVDCERPGAVPLLERRDNLGGGRSARSLGASIRRSEGVVLRKNVYKRQPTSREALEGIEPETQFGRMCAKLGIRIIAASSPQAKGRVERHHGTHQDRLIKKMRLQGICDYEAANRYLGEQYLGEPTPKSASQRRKRTFISARPSVSSDNDRVVRFDRFQLQRLWRVTVHKRARASCR